MSGFRREVEDMYVPRTVGTELDQVAHLRPELDPKSYGIWIYLMPDHGVRIRSDQLREEASLLTLKSPDRSEWRTIGSPRVPPSANFFTCTEHIGIIMHISVIESTGL